MCSSFIYSDQNLESWEELKCLSIGEQIPNCGTVGGDPAANKGCRHSGWRPSGEDMGCIHSGFQIQREDLATGSLHVRADTAVGTRNEDVRAGMVSWERSGSQSIQ